MAMEKKTLKFFDLLILRPVLPIGFTALFCLFFGSGLILFYFFFVADCVEKPSISPTT